MKKRASKTAVRDDTFGAEPSEATTLPEGSKAVGRRGDAITEIDAPPEKTSERGDPQRGFAREVATEAHVPAVERSSTQKRTAVLRSRVTRLPNS